MKNLPKIALGAWAWGNDGTFGTNLTAETLQPIFETAMQNGLNLWDTAYAYGMGTSEKVLAGFVGNLERDSYLISDKFTPQCAKPSGANAFSDMVEMQLDLMGLDRFEIEAAVPYTDADVAYYTNCRADQEQRDPSARPAIADTVENMARYSTVVIAYPIWHGQAPKIIYTFLESYDFSGKTIIPFCTSASSPLGTSASNLHALAPNALWEDGRRFAAGTSRQTVETWLKDMGY